MAEAFAGPLCRFYAGQDEALVRRYVEGVLAWREDLTAGLSAAVQQSLDWNEDVDFAGQRFDLGESGFMALRLFAFYAERSELELPDTVPALLELDRDYRQASDEGFPRSLYGQLLACRCWLPAEFPLTLKAPLPDGETAEVGSLPILRDQLRWLNQRTFQAAADTLIGWRAEPAPAGGALLSAAQRGLSTLTAAADEALAMRLPLIVREF